MPYEFEDCIKPQGTNNFSLLEDNFLKGGFHIVDTKLDLDNLDPSIIKKGMLVAVNEENGNIYKCSDFSSVPDEFGDLITKSTFVPFKIAESSDPASSSPDSLYERPTKKINFSYVAPNESFDIPVDMGCKSFILTRLTVSTGRKVKIKIYANALKNDPIPFEFDSSKKNYMDGSTYLKNKARFQYKKYRVFVNTETSLSQRKIFLFNCTSLEDSSYYTSKGFSYSIVQLELTYIPLET